MLSESFLEYIKEERLFHKDDHLLLAISGGLDSVVLAHLLKHNGFKFSLAHMNFQLRGEASELDQLFVQKLGEELEAEVFVERVEIKQKGSTQIQARELRYAWFNQLMERYSFAKVVTAHHANDLLETALLNLIRGTGVKGLRGILPLQKILARPLLFAEKVELEEFAKRNSIEWREDVSNASDHYTRNKIRHRIIPELKLINPNLPSGYQQTALRLRATEAAWEEKLTAVSKDYFNFQGKQVEIDKSILKISHWLVYLSELLRDYGFNLAQLQSFGFERIGAQLFSSQYVLSIDRDKIFVSETNGISYQRFFPQKLSTEENFAITPFGKFKWNIIDRTEVEFIKNLNRVFIDYERLKEPIEVDLWHEGDKIQPFGMRGQKKISDILIDQKVALPRKEKIQVLKSKGEVIWIVGYKFSDLFKINNSTKKVLRIEYYENTESI